MKKILVNQTAAPNVVIVMDTAAPTLNWLIFDTNWNVVASGISKKPKPFFLPPGNYLFECQFGGPAGTTAAATITTPHASSPFPQPPFVSRVPNAGGTATFSVGFQV